MILRNSELAQRRLVRAAFTLMELLVVMAIIVIIAGFGGYYVLGRLDEAKVDQARNKARNIEKAITTYKIEHDGEEPAGLEALIQKSPIGKGPYLTNVDEIRDPWGHLYQLDMTGAKNTANGAVVVIPDVFTQTPDGRTVGNWIERRK